MLGFCPLASGSKGNALYFGSPEAKILIDSGISLKELGDRLGKIGVEPGELDAVLVTHEHIDHIRGLSVLCKKWNIPVFANLETAKSILAACTHPPKFKIFSTGDTFTFKDILIHPFSIPHDAIDPVAFTLQLDSLKVGICADLGFASSVVMHHLQNCDYLYLEANHQPSMVHASSRPMVYKQRVLGRQGHLSNEASGEILNTVHSDRLKHVYLAHLSSECNSPETALRVIGEALEKKGKSLPLSIAPQHEIGLPITLF